MDRETALRVKPTRNHVLVETLPEAALSDGGIIIPETAKLPPQRARVIRTAEPGSWIQTRKGVPGKGKVQTLRQYTPTVQPDDVVLCLGYERVLFESNEPGRGGEIRLISEDHVLGVVE